MPSDLPGRWPSAPRKAGRAIFWHNHGTIQIGDTLLQVKNYSLPVFHTLLRKCSAVCIWKIHWSRNSCKKAWKSFRGGATQVFMPQNSNDLIVGAVGVMQVWSGRIPAERRVYKVDCIYEPVSINTVRWVSCEDERNLSNQKKSPWSVVSWWGRSLDLSGPKPGKFELMQERYPDIQFPCYPWTLNNQIKQLLYEAVFLGGWMTFHWDDCREHQWSVSRPYVEFIKINELLEKKVVSMKRETQGPTSVIVIGLMLSACDASKQESKQPDQEQAPTWVLKPEQAECLGLFNMSGSSRQKFALPFCETKNCIDLSISNGTYRDAG